MKLAQRQVPGQVAGGASAASKANGFGPQIQWISSGEEAKPGRKGTIGLVTGTMEFYDFPETVGNVIIPTDELHHFSEGWVNHQPVMITVFLSRTMDFHQQLW